jgi:hypothetical protein
MVIDQFTGIERNQKAVAGLHPQACFDVDAEVAKLERLKRKLHDQG